MGQKSQNDTLFFPILYENFTALMPILKKKSQLPKKHIALIPYFVKKTSLLSKTRFYHVIFFQIIHENPILSCSSLVKRTSIMSKLSYLMGQKINRMLFCPIFHEKTILLLAIFCQKNVHSLEKTML